MSFVTPALAVGGTVHQEDIADLRALGVTHIINVNWPDRPEPQAVVDAFSHLDLTILDDAEPKPESWFRSGINFAATLGPTDKLLVHCGHGINRSPAMAYAILRAQGHDETTAEQMVRFARPQTGAGSTGACFAVYCDSADEAVA